MQVFTKLRLLSLLLCLFKRIEGIMRKSCFSCRSLPLEQTQDLRIFTFEPPFVGAQGLALLPCVASVRKS